jgi:2-oxoglutarate ferredoxin oxidoreductase subunit alpha
VIKSLYLADGELEKHIWRLVEKYKRVEQEVNLFETKQTEDADLIVVAFGTAARICKTSVKMARDLGLRVGLVRPISLYPFPAEILRSTSEKTKKYLVVELNAGQMVEDVRLSVKPGTDVSFYGRPCGAGSLPKPNEILEKIQSVCGGSPASADVERGSSYETRV